MSVDGTRKKNIDIRAGICLIKCLTNYCKDILKGHCIEFKYYADVIHSGLTPPGNNS